ncbi:MAG: hypothetical protein AAF655_22175 [Bacteroidota bacterium]
MKEAVNITEASRYLIDRLRKSSLDPLQVQAVCSQSMNVASILLRIAEEKDQKIILAAMLFGSFRLEVIQGEEILRIFGKDVHAYVCNALDAQSLAIPSLKRLQAKKEQQLVRGGRRIYIANAAASLKEAQDYSPQYAILSEEELRPVLTSFEGVFPKLDSYVEKLSGKVD